MATAAADRLLELVAPHTVARATDCDYYCCGVDRWQRCCFYPDGHYRCDSCFYSSSAAQYC
jgi:hypothetical protein